jgi:uncharacterized protein (TIGR00730 family)
MPDTVENPLNPADPAETSRLWRDLVRRLAALEGAPNGDLLRGLLSTVLSMSEGRADRRDLKMAHLALKEAARAMKVFSTYRHTPKVAVFGSARTKPDESIYDMAVEFAREIAGHGFMVLTGAGGGIMEAANRGAGREASFGLNIELPFEQSVNRFVEGDPKLLEFRFFFTRKLFFLKETRALALFPGGFGTLDEGFEALTLIQTGKSTPLPIVLMEREGSGYWEEWHDYLTDHLLARGLIHKNDMRLFRICHTVEEGIAEITGFFRVFHSAYRTHSGVTVWTWRPLEEPEIDRLNDAFADMLGGKRITQLYRPPAQLSDTEEEALSCIDVPMDHRFQGRLRQLIDAINAL